MCESMRRIPKGPLACVVNSWSTLTPKLKLKTRSHACGVSKRRLNASRTTRVSRILHLTNAAQRYPQTDGRPTIRAVVECIHACNDSVIEVSSSHSAWKSALHACSTGCSERPIAPRSREASRPPALTRALEASYLAAGQGARLEMLKRLRDWMGSPDRLRSFCSAQLGALVELTEDDASSKWVFLAPDGGSVVTVGNLRIATISPSAPLGRAITGLENGDSAELVTPAGPRDVEILSVY